MLLKIAVLIAVGLCVGWMVPVYRKRERKKQIVKAIVALSAMPLDRIPDVASGFRRFVKEVHGVDLLEMTYDQQVDYVQKNLFTLWRPELNACIDIPMSGELEWGIVIFGTAPYYQEYADRTFALARKYFDRALDLRRSGSAAIDLCNVAAGRAEIYFECVLSPWDFAAGSLIVEEAGGKVGTLEGGPLILEKKCSVLATNGVAEAIALPETGEGDL